MSQPSSSRRARTRAARARQEVTGEPYTTAARAVDQAAERPAENAEDNSHRSWVLALSARADAAYTAFRTAGGRTSSAWDLALMNLESQAGDAAGALRAVERIEQAMSHEWLDSLGPGEAMGAVNAKTAVWRHWRAQVHRHARHATYLLAAAAAGIAPSAAPWTDPHQAAGHVCGEDCHAAPDLDVDAAFDGLPLVELRKVSAEFGWRGEQLRDLYEFTHDADTGEFSLPEYDIDAAKAMEDDIADPDELLQAFAAAVLLSLVTDLAGRLTVERITARAT